MANNFLLDPKELRAVALYTYDSASLNDSLGGNHLTQSVWPAAQVTPTGTPPREGTSSISWDKQLYGNGDESDSGYSWERTNTNLASNFPGQSTNPSDGLSFCTWMYFNWLAYDDAGDWIDGAMKKGGCVGFQWQDTSNPGPGGGYELFLYFGTTLIWANSGNELQNGRWYHVGYSIQEGDTETGIANLAIWDHTAQTVVVAYTVNRVITMPSGNVNKYSVWSQVTGGGGDSLNRHEDRFDETVLFNRMISLNDIHLIRQGLYPGKHLIHGQSEVTNITSPLHQEPGAHCTLLASGTLRGMVIDLSSTISCSATLSPTLVMTGDAMHINILNTQYFSPPPTLRGDLFGLDSINYGSAVISANLTHTVRKLQSSIAITSGIVDATLENASIWMSGTFSINNSFSAVTLDIWQTGFHVIPLLGVEVDIITNFTAGLTKSDVEMRGISDITIALEALMSRTVAMAGNITIETTFVADLEVYRSLIGSSAIVFTLNGESGNIIGLVSNIHIQTYFTGWIGLSGEMRGQFAIIHTLTGNVVATKRFISNIAIQTFFTAWIGFPGEMRGEFVIISNFVNADLMKAKFLTSNINILTVFNGNLIMPTLLLYGSFDIQTLISAHLRYRLADFMISRYSNHPILEHKSCIVTRETLLA